VPRFNGGMESRHHLLIARGAFGLLIAVLGAGLWFGYGPWLVDRVREHVG